MSQKPPQKSNFLQTLLIATTIFLAYQLFFDRKSETPNTRSINEMLLTMRDQNKKLLDVSIVKELPAYEKKVKEEVEKGKLSKEEGEQLLLEGVLLVADTQYRTGVLRNDTDRLTAAYQTLESRERKYEGTFLWNATIPVEPIAQFEEKAISPAKLYDDITKQLIQRNKSDLVWGFFPGYALLHALVKFTGAVPGFSYAFAAFALALLVRTIVWPLAKKTMIHSRQMLQLTPLLNELKEKYQGLELNQKVSELYKEYKVHPASGCLPAVAQIPLFWIIYQSMIQYKFEFKNGTFLWINPHFSEMTNGLIAPSLGQTDYILIVLYGISMMVTTLLNPVSDPVNAKQQKTTGVMISVVFAFMMFFWPLPSAFVLYWFFLNIFSTLQTLYIQRIPIPPLMKQVNSSGTLAPVSSLMNGTTFGKTGVPKTFKPKKRK